LKQTNNFVYEVSENWPQDIPCRWVNVTGIAADSGGNVYAAGGEKEPIIVCSADGIFLRSFGSVFIKGKHGLRIFNDKVWITDIDLHQVFECTLDGKLIRSFGKAGVAGDGVNEFNKPTDVAIAANGDIYITDGYGNSRIVCLDGQGNYKFSWGSKGSRKGEFVHPHNIVIDKQNRIYVADRGNFRIQIFDDKGRYITQWNNAGQPYGLYYYFGGGEEFICVTDGNANGDHRVLIMDTNGNILSQFGHKGSQPGMFETPHSVTMTGRNAMYIAEAAGKRIQKFILARK